MKLNPAQRPNPNASLFSRVLTDLIFTQWAITIENSDDFKKPKLNNHLINVIFLSQILQSFEQAIGLDNHKDLFAERTLYNQIYQIASEIGSEFNFRINKTIQRRQPREPDSDKMTLVHFLRNGLNTLAPVTKDIVDLGIDMKSSLRVLASINLSSEGSNEIDKKIREHKEGREYADSVDVVSVIEESEIRQGQNRFFGRFKNLQEYIINTLNRFLADETLEDPIYTADEISGDPPFIVGGKINSHYIIAAQVDDSGAKATGCPAGHKASMLGYLAAMDSVARIRLSKVSEQDKATMGLLDFLDTTQIFLDNLEMRKYYTDEDYFAEINHEIHGIFEVKGEICGELMSNLPENGITIDGYAEVANELVDEWTKFQ